VKDDKNPSLWPTSLKKGEREKIRGDPGGEVEKQTYIKNR
jgi:hypothetical protein